VSDAVGKPDCRYETFRADGDLADYRYRAVKFSGSPRLCALCTSPADLSMLGVLHNRPHDQTGASVAILGKSKIVAGAAITAGDLLTVDSSGRAITASSGDMTFGRALHAANAADEVFESLVFQPFRLC
jgi:hypothetical protein